MKIKITQEQYKKILIHEQKSRTSLLKEEKEVENMSYDDLKVLLSLAKLIGIPLSGHNEFIADKNIKKKEILTKIKDILEDGSKLEEWVEKFNEKGMTQADEKLAHKSEQIVDEFNKIAHEVGLGKKLDMLAKHTLKELKTT